MDDVTLVRLCLEGENWAFDELVRRYRDRVYGMALHLLGDRELAEDLAQETFLRAFQRLTMFDPNKGSFSTWLLTLTTRLCLNALKKRTAEQQWLCEQDESLEVLEPREISPSPEEQWWEVERRVVVQQILLTLPPPQRAALLLRYGEGMSIQEIAQALQVPIGTVKGWLFRGRETLRRKLKGVGLM
ncbi:MAG: RNA polymerase sigma factor [Candidatus Fervidibacter sp.]|uniref:RNA polymerase sigma factor n=1 Tax=Candidatus Fervidibacter sp. TaxID=3100871 RepID=UPI0040493CF6